MYIQVKGGVFQPFVQCILFTTRLSSFGAEEYNDKHPFSRVKYDIFFTDNLNKPQPQPPLHRLPSLLSVYISSYAYIRSLSICICMYIFTGGYVCASFMNMEDRRLTKGLFGYSLTGSPYLLCMEPLQKINLLTLSASILNRFTYMMLLCL